MIRLGTVLLAALWIAAAAAALAVADDVHQTDPQKVQRELKDILSDPEYNRAYGKTASQVAWDFMGRKIGDFFNWIGRYLRIPFGASAGRLVSFILAWAVVVAFVILVVKVIQRLTEAGRGGAAAALPGGENYDLPSAGPLIRQAAELARAGDYRGAFRCAYIASISYLDEIKALRFERSRTNWEYLRELKDGGRDEQVAELRPLTLDFDRKFYGSEPCDQRDYENAVAVYQRIVQGGVA